MENSPVPRPPSSTLCVLRATRRGVTVVIGEAILINNNPEGGGRWEPYDPELWETITASAKHLKGQGFEIECTSGRYIPEDDFPMPEDIV